ncbi:MAG: hypothetical protein TYPL_1300 [Candidatus Tyloplasma litorale]|nr:MAG: hypothetical protein TYPL_1300 [Mycoplasmatales bacterium]
MLLESLLKDNLINKSELILKKYKNLNIVYAEAKFLSKMFVDKNQNFSNLTIEKICELLDVSNKTAEKIVHCLLKKNFIKYRQINNTSYFDFEFLIEKLLNSYLPPEENSKISQKITWIDSELDIELTKENKMELQKIISNNDNWKQIVKIINKISEIKDKDWSMVSAAISSFNSNFEFNSDKYKEILDSNWLE